MPLYTTIIRFHKIIFFSKYAIPFRIWAKCVVTDGWSQIELIDVMSWRQTTLIETRNQDCNLQLIWQNYNCGFPWRFPDHFTAKYKRMLNTIPWIIIFSWGTTIGGLTGSYPDYALIVVGANMGVQKMTKEHIQVAASLKVKYI